MDDSELDNPFWSSLHTRHHNLAIGIRDVMRYPPDFAPFLGVAGAAGKIESTLLSLVAPDETVLLLGVAPQLSDAWRLQTLETLAQMVCESPLPLTDGPEIIELDASHRADVLALTALVYPHYFRPRTMEMGRYFGIYVPGAAGEARLAAMIGERLGTDTYTEMSAICTHPDFAGRGYASRLLHF